MVLSGLRAPGNVERRLTDLQTRLFQELGLVSARALPPLIPVGWTEAPPRLEALGPAPLPPLEIGVPAPVTPPPTARPTGTYGGAVVVSVEPFEPLRELAAKLFPPAVAPPFPLPPPAFLLALTATEDEAIEAASLLSSPGKERGGTSKEDSDTTPPTGVVVRTCTVVSLQIEMRGAAPWELSPGEPASKGPASKESAPSLRVVWKEVARRRLRKQRPIS